MRIGLYLVRDAKAEAFLSQPIMAVTPGLAERQFVDAMGTPESILGKHPGDFSLWEIGILDITSGALIPCSPREVLSGPTVLTLLGKGQ